MFFYDEHGGLKALPASWTDAAEPDPFVAVANGRAHFRPADLVQLATLIARLCGRGDADEGDDDVR